MKFREFIQQDAIIVPLVSSEREGVIRELVDSLGRSGAIEADAVEEVAAALIARERAGTTGFGRGVAAPHCKHPKITRLIGTIGLSEKGIEFAARDYKPVYAVFMLLSPKGQDQKHLEVMEMVFKNLQEDKFRGPLRQANTKEKLIELLEETDGI